MYGRSVWYILAILFILVAVVPGRADNSTPYKHITFTQISNATVIHAGTSPLTLKFGTYYLGDDTAGSNYGGGSKVSAGLEYRLPSLDVGSHSVASMYLDYSIGHGDGGGVSLFSAGIAQRFSLRREMSRGATPYVGVGIGANFNAFNRPDHQANVRQLAFAQKVIFGMRRTDGAFYEIYFRAAPQNSSIITSGLGISYGYNL